MNCFTNVNHLLMTKNEKGNRTILVNHHTLHCLRAFADGCSYDRLIKNAFYSINRRGKAENYRSITEIRRAGYLGNGDDLGVLGFRYLEVFCGLC